MKQDTLTRSSQAFQSALQAVVNLFLDRGTTGPSLRLLVLLTSLGLYWFVLGLLADFPQVLPGDFLTTQPFFVRVALDIVTSFFAPEIIIHLLPVVLGLALGFLFGALYIADLFELDSIGLAFRYLIGAVFGLGHAKLKINAGEVEALDRKSPLLRVGGPGYLEVHLGFAAVFETIDGRPQVYGNMNQDGNRAKAFIRGFERLRDVVDLRDQLREVDEIPSVTRDGVEIFARDAQMVFRVYGGMQPRSLSSPYPYTEDGIRRLVYAQAVSEKGAGRWTDALPGLVRHEIRRFVAGLTIEEFLALQPSRLLEEQANTNPRGVGAGARSRLFHIPRRQLTTRFHTDEVKERLKRQGLELVWVGVGTWEVRDEQGLSAQRVMGAGTTLATTWTNLQRARLYRSPAYRDRERKRSAEKRASEVILDLINAWKDESLGKDYRCFALLSTVTKRLTELERLVAPQPDQDLPLDFRAALEHLHQLIQRSVI